MDSGGGGDEKEVYQVTPLSVPWFPQGTVPDGPGHLFVMFLVAFVQVQISQNIRKNSLKVFSRAFLPPTGSQPG